VEEGEGLGEVDRTATKILFRNNSSRHEAVVPSSYERDVSSTLWNNFGAVVCSRNRNLTSHTQIGLLTTPSPLHLHSYTQAGFLTILSLLNLPQSPRLGNVTKHHLPTSSHLIL
jgi:hypothetical protein